MPAEATAAVVVASKDQSQNDALYTILNVHLYFGFHRVPCTVVCYRCICMYAKMMLMLLLLLRPLWPFFTSFSRNEIGKM